MSQKFSEFNIPQLVTEDDTPVDNIFSEKQQRLLTEPLYSSWKPNTTFLATANVGLFSDIYHEPLVPDMLLSLDVEITEKNWPTEQRSYMLWQFGKPPDVVIEVVSNRIGQENTKKMERYLRMRIPYYVIFDPFQELSDEVLTIYASLDLRKYIKYHQSFLSEIGLGLTLWKGLFEGTSATWLRWCDEQGNLIATGEERAEQEKTRAEQEKIRADQLEQKQQQSETQISELTEQLQQVQRQSAQEKEQIEKMAAKLKALGIDLSDL